MLQFPLKYKESKRLRKLNCIGREEPRISARGFTENMVALIKQQQSKGLQFRKLEMAVFKTKNGLPYTGFVATEKICANEVFVCVPAHLMITAKGAFFSKLHQVYVENPQFFSFNYHSYHCINILWAFLLYENSLGQASELYYMLQSYPRGTDYLDLWSASDLSLLQDERLAKRAAANRKQFDADYNQLAHILSRYPQFFSDASAYDQQTAQWIYASIATRIFGARWPNQGLIPFVELVNHEAAKCFWETLRQEKNLEQCQGQLGPSTDLTDEEEDNADTNSDTYYSIQTETDGMYDLGFEFDEGDVNSEAQLQEQLPHLEPGKHAEDEAQQREEPARALTA